MTSKFDTILLLGATSGIGEAFARYFHSKGKKVIIAGRRIDRLNALKSELKGVEAFQIDLENVESLESSIKGVIEAFPNLDSVFVLAGISTLSFFKDPQTIPVEQIVSQVAVNFTAPMLVARIIIPHLLSLKRPTTFLTVGSSLAFIPIPLLPVYNAAKAGVHTFTIGLRAQLADTDVNVIELVPPYVDTDLDAKFRQKQIDLQGGEAKAAKPMPIKEYMEKVTALLEKDGQKEIAVGFGEIGVTTYRNAFGPLFEKFGVKG